MPQLPQCLCLYLYALACNSSKFCPTSSSVWSVTSSMPNLCLQDPPPLGVRVWNTLFICSWRLYLIAASGGDITFLSSIKSPRWLSSSSPIGVQGISVLLQSYSTFLTLSIGSFHLSSKLLRRGLSAKLLHKVP